MKQDLGRSVMSPVKRFAIEFYKLERSFCNKYAMGKWWDTYKNCCIYIGRSFIFYNKFFLWNVPVIWHLAIGLPIHFLARVLIKALPNLKIIFWYYIRFYITHVISWYSCSVWVFITFGTDNMVNFNPGWKTFFENENYWKWDKCKY